MANAHLAVAPLTLEDLPECFRPTLKAVHSSAGEALVLDENMFIGKMLPGVTQRALSADEMTEYRRPFLQAGDDRLPTLQWAREVPLSSARDPLMSRHLRLRRRWRRWFDTTQAQLRSRRSRWARRLTLRDACARPPRHFVPAPVAA